MPCKSLHGQHPSPVRLICVRVRRSHDEDCHRPHAQVHPDHPDWGGGEEACGVPGGLGQTRMRGSGPVAGADAVGGQGRAGPGAVLRPGEPDSTKT